MICSLYNMLNINFWHQKEKELWRTNEILFLHSMGIHIIYLRQRIVESEFIVTKNKKRKQKKGKASLVKRERTCLCPLPPRVTLLDNNNKLPSGTTPTMSGTTPTISSIGLASGGTRDISTISNEEKDELSQSLQQELEMLREQVEEFNNL